MALHIVDYRPGPNPQPVTIDLEDCESCGAEFMADQHYRLTDDLSVYVRRNRIVGTHYGDDFITCVACTPPAVRHLLNARAR